MKKLIGLLMLIGIFTFQGCDEDNLITGGIIPEPDLVGCEATSFYEWDNYEFSSALDGGSTTWLGFSLEETTLFSINLNQAGFHCVIFEGCDGELGSPPPVHQFFSNGNGQEVGIIYAGDYYLEITNTRPTFLDFTFSINLNDIVYGCLDMNAENYNADANIDDDSCVYQDCNTEHYLADWPDGMVLDCYGNCAPVEWLGDGFCDQGGWGIYDEEGNLIPVYLWCEDLNWDNGDCDEIDEGCPEGQIEDCNQVCAPTEWIGDGICDDGTVDYGFGLIDFNCPLHNNDNGDCDALQRSTQERQLPNGRIRVQ